MLGVANSEAPPALDLRKSKKKKGRRQANYRIQIVQTDPRNAPLILTQVQKENPQATAKRKTEKKTEKGSLGKREAKIGRQYRLMQCNAH